MRGGSHYNTITLVLHPLYLFRTIDSSSHSLYVFDGLFAFVLSTLFLDLFGEKSGNGVLKVDVQLICSSKPDCILVPTNRAIIHALSLLLNETAYAEDVSTHQSYRSPCNTHTDGATYDQINESYNYCILVHMQYLL
jgi:hypothetical protein